MPVSVSTDPIRPSERQAFWTEALCRSFASVETYPLGAAAVSGHFEFVAVGDAKLVRFDSSPQCYRRDGRLVSRDGSDDFMFDVQRLGCSRMAQGRNAGTIMPGHGVLYDARRPFEDRLDGPQQRCELLIATVPARRLLKDAPEAEQLCATPIPLTSTIARAIVALVSAAVSNTAEDTATSDLDIVAYLAALLRFATDRPHQLGRSDLFALIDVHLRRRIAARFAPAALAHQFGISERTFHRLFADRQTTFERHLLRRRVERLRELLARADHLPIPIATLALECGFADAAHASRTFRDAFAMTPRDYRAIAQA